MAAAVKCAGVAFSYRIIGNRRPRFVIQINVFRQFGADFGVWFLCCIIHLIPEPFQPLGGVDLIGICLRAAAGDVIGGAVKCAAVDGTAAGDCVVKDAAGDGSVVDDLAVEFAAFDGAAGGNGHFAIEHSLAGAYNGTGIVGFSQHDVAVHQAAVGVKLPIDIRIPRRAGDV